MVNQALISLIKSARARILALALCFCVSITASWALDPISVSVEPRNITMNETVNVNFTFNQSDINAFNFPRNTASYDVVATSSSSSVQVINGKVSQSKTLSYVLKPLRIGTMTVPAVSYNINNQAYQTPPVQVNIRGVQQNIAQNPGVPNSAPPVSSPANQSMDPIIINSVSNQSPYVNQQFLIKTKIYHRGNIRGLDLALLKIDHLNMKKIDQAKEYTEVKDGMEYMVYEVDYIAFPLKSGSITIPEYDVKAIILSQRARPRNGRVNAFALMNAFFEQHEVVVKAPALQVNVRPIPSNAPKGFTGYVGTLAVNHQADKLNIQSGDAITIKTNVYGNGNPKNLQFNFFEESSLYSIYKDKENLNQEINKDFEYFGLNASSAIIPEKKSGRITIRTKPLISFNPYTKSFEEHGEQEFEVFVKPVVKHDSNGKLIVEDENKLGAIQAKKEEFKKELSIFSIEEILAYKAWKNFDSSYLLIFLVLLNFAYFTRFTLRRVKFQVGDDKASAKELINKVKQATELEEVSSIIKDLEKGLNIAPDLKSKFASFTTETDKYNYGLKQDLDELKLSEFKNKAIELIKELKQNAK